MSQSQVRTNAEKYNFTAEKAHFAKSSRQGLENLRSDLPILEFHADHDAIRIILLLLITVTKYRTINNLSRMSNRTHLHSDMCQFKVWNVSP